LRKSGKIITVRFRIINVVKNPRSEIEAEAYLTGTLQGELVLRLSKEHPRTHGRTARLFALAPLSPASELPVSRFAFGGFIEYPG